MKFFNLLFALVSSVAAQAGTAPAQPIYHLLVTQPGYNSGCVEITRTFPDMVNDASKRLQIPDYLIASKMLPNGFQLGPLIPGSCGEAFYCQLKHQAIKTRGLYLKQSDTVPVYITFGEYFQWSCPQTSYHVILEDMCMEYNGIWNDAKYPDFLNQFATLLRQDGKTLVKGGCGTRCYDYYTGEQQTSEGMQIVTYTRTDTTDYKSKFSGQKDCKPPGQGDKCVNQTHYQGCVTCNNTDRGFGILDTNHDGYVSESEVDVYLKEKASSIGKDEYDAVVQFSKNIFPFESSDTPTVLNKQEFYMFVNAFARNFKLCQPEGTQSIQYATSGGVNLFGIGGETEKNSFVF